MPRGIRITQVLVVGAMGSGAAGQTSLAAQDSQEQSERPVTTTQRLDGDVTLTLPIDSVSQGLLLLPGIEQSDAGQLIIRGGTTRDHGVYLDGVPVSPAQRTSGFLFNQGTSLREILLDPALSIGTNAFNKALVTTGAYEPVYGNAASGIVTITTRAPDGRINGAVRYATDEPAGTSHGVGINRFMGDVGGAITSRVRFYVAAVMEGRQSADNGPGTNQVPLFVPGANDTVVAVPSGIWDPVADTSFVAVSQYPVFRGQCDTFGASQNAEIVSNYGFDCTGIRLPAAARSGYQLLGKIDFDLTRTGRLWLSAVTTQDQNRLFDYASLTNGQQLQAHRSVSSALTLGYRHHLGDPGGGWTLFGALSLQRDLSELGPLTTTSEAESRYPTGGFMLKSFDFLFGFDAFPVDDQLVDNYRSNTPQSRRSPYDLENTDQYGLSSRFLSNPSATSAPLEFVESGGPIGRVNLFREKRTVGVASATWRADGHNTMTFGGEYTGYSIENYSHALTSQALSDVYIQTPRRAALYIQDRLQFDRFTMVGGIRVDAFDSEAQRPYLLDLDPTSATFDQYVYYPRTFSYQGTAPDGRPLTTLVEDQGHTAVTPHLQMGYSIAEHDVLWASAGLQAQMPDLYQSYAGVNTDLSITNTSQMFGTDLEFNKVAIAEVGMRHRFSPAVSLEGAAYFKEHTRETVLRLESLQDPLAQRQVDLLLYRIDGGRTVKGFDVRLDTRFGSVFQGFVGYSYANAETPAGLTPSDTRPHSLSGALTLALPGDWHAGTTIGAMGRNFGVYTIFRFATGTSYTRCPQETGNEFLLSGDRCTRQNIGEFNGSRLPGIKQLDLRIAKGFPIGGTFLNAFLDIRNLVNFGNTHRAYATTGTAENQEALDEVLQSGLDGYFNEGLTNGAAQSDGSIVLPDTGACADWYSSQGFEPAAPNCIYLIRTEQRYGDGDGIFDVDEQERAITAFYRVLRDASNFHDPPRRIRLGFELKF